MKKKKALALLLSASVVLSNLPVMGFAEGEESFGKDQKISED